MAAQVEIRYDCGFSVTYPLPRDMKTLPSQRQSFYEAMADSEHDQRCSQCKEEAYEQPVTKAPPVPSEMDPQDHDPAVAQ